MGQSQRETRFLTVGSSAVNRSGFRSFIESRAEPMERFGCIILFPRADELQVASFQRVQPRFDASIVQALPRAVTHSPFR